MNTMLKHTFISGASLFLIPFLSCSSSSLQENQVPLFDDGTPVVTSETLYDGKDTFTLTLAGDLMAHKPNWIYGDFEKALEVLAPIARKSDLSFINLETPVLDTSPYSTYPYFNVHHEYVQAVIDTGFNLFSLSNNHTNDQGLKGIQETKKWFDKIRTETAASERPVYSSGLKDSKESPLTVEVIEKNGWKILFLAITELLNQNTHTDYINFIRPDEKNRKLFYTTVNELKEKHAPDIFIISIHTSEPEYVLTTTKTQKDHYKKLLDNGADVIVANHPHVAKEWYLYGDADNNPEKVVFLAQGNTLSAQRNDPDFSNPSNIRDYTGDGFITTVRFEKSNGKITIVNIDPVMLTVYKTEERHYIVKLLDDEFIKYLKDNEKTTWAAYIEKRKKLMEKIKGKNIWQ